MKVFDTTQDLWPVFQEKVTGSEVKQKIEQSLHREGAQGRESCCTEDSF